MANDPQRFPAPVQLTSSVKSSGPAEVVITSIRIPFGEMVNLMIKLIIAMFIANVLLALVLFAAFMFLGGLAFYGTQH